MKGCKVEGCDRKHECRGYCGKHYAQVRKHGKILERTIYDKNDYYDKGDCYAIILRSKGQEIVGEALVSKEDLEKVITRKWHMDAHGYAVSGNRGGFIKMHRFITDAPPDVQVDHRDRDRLNNTRDNLRVADATQNAMNRTVQSNNKLGIKGISERPNGKYRARITVNRKTINLGDHDTLHQAVEARLEAEKKYFGEWGEGRE